MKRVNGYAMFLRSSNSSEAKAINDPDGTGLLGRLGEELVLRVNEWLQVFKEVAKRPARMPQIGMRSDSAIVVLRSYRVKINSVFANARFEVGIGRQCHSYAGGLQSNGQTKHGENVARASKG
jgi:hypothetical protein